MNILIKNATLISMSENREKIEKNIDIKIIDNKISEIGYKLNDENVEKVINATEKVVMPGLINTHAHVPMSIFRETVDGYTLQDWLSKKIWPMEDKLTDEDIYYASMLTYLEMIKTGTTTINDLYFMTESIVEAAKEAKIRLQTSRTLMGSLNDEGGQNRLKEQKELIEKYKDTDELITFNYGIHGLYTCEEQYVEKCIEESKKINLPIHMHFCENAKEVEDIKKEYKCTPMDVIEKYFSDKKVIFAHCVKLSKEEIKRLSKFNVSVAHCPVSNLKLGCGIADINEMVKQGINVTIGTDGQGSGCNLDLFESMKYTALLQKGNNENPTLLSAYEVLKMATINSAKALSLEDKVGSIEIGKLADIIILDYENDIVTNPVNDLISDIVYNFKGSNVSTTIVNGKILMEDKILENNLEEEQYIIMGKCKEIIDRISKK